MKQIPTFVLCAFVVTGSALGFGDYDPNRICYQAWCYTGDAGNSVGSIVEPHEYVDGVGLGAFILRHEIEFMEMPFEAGNYHIRATLITNRAGILVSEQVFNGGVKMRDSIVSMPFSSYWADKFKRGRFFKVYIYRNSKLYTSATFPLYGFTKAWRHMH